MLLWELFVGDAVICELLRVPPPLMLATYELTIISHT